MRDNSTVLNVNSVYSGNMVFEDDGSSAVSGWGWCDITNIQTTFEENTGPDGIVMLWEHGSLINNASTFR